MLMQGVRSMLPPSVHLLITNLRNFIVSPGTEVLLRAQPRETSSRRNSLRYPVNRHCLMVEPSPGSVLIDFALH